jgi:hypothetical protein
MFADYSDSPNLDLGTKKTHSDADLATKTTPAGNAFPVTFEGQSEDDSILNGGWLCVYLNAGFL